LSFFPPEKIIKELFLNFLNFRTFELLPFSKEMNCKWKKNKGSKVQKVQVSLSDFFSGEKTKSSGVKSSKSKCLSSECFGLTSQKQKYTHTH